MKAREMVPGVWYCQEGTVSPFELRHFTKNDRGQEWAIISEPGEEDMQSMWGIPADSIVYRTAAQPGKPDESVLDLTSSASTTVHRRLMEPPEGDL